MATSFTLEHEFECAAEDYWRLKRDPTLDQEICKFAGGTCKWLESDFEGEEHLVIKEIEIPSLLPSAVLELTEASTVRYTLIQRRRVGTDVMYWEIGPELLNGRVELSGRLVVVPIREGVINRRIEGMLDIDIPRTAELMERVLIDGIRNAYEDGADTIRLRLERGG